MFKITFPWYEKITQGPTEILLQLPHFAFSLPLAHKQTGAEPPCVLRTISQGNVHVAQN